MLSVFGLGFFSGFYLCYFSVFLSFYSSQVPFFGKLLCNRIVQTH